MVVAHNEVKVLMLKEEIDGEKNSLDIKIKDILKNNYNGKQSRR